MRPWATNLAAMSEAQVASMDLRDYMRVLVRRKLTIAVTTIVVVGAGLALSFTQTPVYQSTTKILVAPRLAEQLAGAEATTGGNQPQRGISTEIEVLNSRSTRVAARERLGHPADVSVAAVGDTQVVALTARSTDPERAAADANGYAETYIELRRQQLLDELLAASEEIQGRVSELDQERADIEGELVFVGGDEAARKRLDDRLRSIEAKRDAYQQQLDDLEVAQNLSVQGGGAEVISQAGTPGSPVSPRPVRNAVAAIGLGLVLGVGLAFLREYLDDTVRNEDDMMRATGLTVVGRIPLVPGWKNRRSPFLVSITSTNSAAAEAYRTLRTNLQFLDLEHPIRSLQVTSASAVEGKTTTLANLAVTMANTGRRVIVVCCDLRRPRIHEFFDLSHEVGFTSVLLGEVPLAQALQPAVGGHLLVLPSGPRPPNPSELLSSQRAADLFDSLSDRCDMLLVDSPPVLPVTDALVISGIVDATLVVGTAGNTAKRGLHSAVRALRQVDAPLVGCVLNGIGPSDAYAYGYTYGYTESESGTKEKSRRGSGNGRGESKRSRKTAGAAQRS